MSKVRYVREYIRDFLHQNHPRVVQEFLGHKDISTALGIYTGVTSDPMKQAADGVDSAMKDVILRRTKSK